MKFTELKTFNNYHLFKFKRNLIDLYSLFKIVINITPSNVLEIGYHEGLTFGLLIESLAEKKTKFTSCDITYDRDKLKNILSFDRCEFYTMNSTNFFTKNMYDFIIIDGEHNCHEMLNSTIIKDIGNYSALNRDFRQFINMLTNGGIIMIDGEKFCAGIENFVKTILPEFPEMQPLIIGHQQIFIGKNFSNYQILNKIIDETKMILSWNYIDYFGFPNVLEYNVKHSKIYENFTKIISYIEK